MKIGASDVFVAVAAVILVAYGVADRDFLYVALLFALLGVSFHLKRRRRAQQ